MQLTKFHPKSSDSYPISPLVWFDVMSEGEPTSSYKGNSSMVHPESGSRGHTLPWNVSPVSGRMHYLKVLVTMSVKHFLSFSHDFCSQDFARESLVRSFFHFINQKMELTNMACSILSLRTCSIILIMHNWRSFILKFKYPFFSTTILLHLLWTSFCKSCIAFTCQSMNFGKLQLKIPKWTRLSIVHSLRVRVWENYSLICKMVSSFFHFNAACTFSKDLKVIMKLFSLYTMIYSGGILFLVW